MYTDDWFILVLNGVGKGAEANSIPAELSKYFVKGKITDIISLEEIKNDEINSKLDSINATRVTLRGLFDYVRLID